MGQSSSKSYPAQPNIIDGGSYTFTPPQPPVQVSAVPGAMDVNRQNFYAQEKNNSQPSLKKMKSNLEMYMLYDNYDSKNKVILLI